MQETGKQEIVSKLYLVRAILSKISNNNEKIEESKERLKEETEKEIKKQALLPVPDTLLKVEIDRQPYKNYSYEIHEYLSSYPDDEDVVAYNRNRSLMNELKNNRDLTYRELLDEKNVVVSEINKIKKYIKNKKIKLFFVLFVIDVLFSLLVWGLFNISQPLFAALVVFLIFAFDFIFVSINSKSVRSLSKQLKEMLKKEKELQLISSKVYWEWENNSEYKKLAYMQKELSEIICKKLKSDDVKRIEALKQQKKIDNEQRIKEIQQTNTEIEKKNIQFEKEHKENIVLLEKEIDYLEADTRNLYLTIKESTKQIIDERDWGNLDIIIYELETGRADSIKEALQQADQYIRHNELMQVMETATQAICVTIRESISELSSSIGAHLSGIKKGMSELKGEFSELRISQEKMNSAFDTLLDEQEMTNALLEKSNVSSKQLAEDISRMRWLRDREFFKKGI